MTFRPGLTSRLKLSGVHPELVRVVVRAYETSEIDFSVVYGRRTAAQQKAIFDAGGSKTLDSRHLTGHAVDLVPYVAGKQHPGNWAMFFTLAEGVWLAAADMGVPLRWGGVWDREFLKLDRAHLDDEVHAYTAREKARGNLRILTDGAHFELPRAIYP